MHTIGTRITAAPRPSGRVVAMAAPQEGTAPLAQRLAAWAERRLLGSPDLGRVPATPHHELPLPWS